MKEILFNVDNPKETVEEVCVSMLSFRDGKEFSGLELYLGFCSFLYWLHTGEVNLSEEHFSLPNVSARNSAINFIKIVAQDDSAIKEIGRLSPGFSITEELNLSQQQLDVESEYWERWKFSLTRSLILITRALAYGFTSHTNLKLVIPNGEESLIDFLLNSAENWPTEDKIIEPRFSNISNLRIKAQKALDDAKRLEKYFLIAGNVRQGAWEVHFSENLEYNEVLMAFAFCSARTTDGLGEVEKNEWVQNFLGFFPQNDEQEDSQLKILNKPSLILEDSDEFILFVVDFNQRSCDLKSNSPRIIIAKVIYWAFQTMAKQLGENSLVNLVKMFEGFGLLKKVK